MSHKVKRIQFLTLLRIASICFAPLDFAMLKAFSLQCTFSPLNYPAEIVNENIRIIL